MSNQQLLEPSEEADEKQLRLAGEAGEAYREATEYMIEEVADTGDKAREGDFVVGFAQEEAEGMYKMRDGELEWVEPSEDENCHLEVIVASAADGRFVPGLDVTATLEDDDGNTVGPAEIPFVWHPGVYHYGRNLELPDDGRYTITIEVGAAEFPRHDEENGALFDESVVVEFDGVQIETGSE